MSVVIAFPTYERAAARANRPLAFDERDQKIAILERELALTNRFLDLAERELIRRDAIRGCAAEEETEK
jgi:hypothetical protein